MTEPGTEPAVARARRRLFSAIRGHAAAHVFQLAARLALVPYVIARLPRDEYGLWAWMLTLSAFLVLAELGFTQGLVHPLAVAAREERSARVGRLMATAMIVPAIVVALIAAVLWAWSPPLATRPTASGVSALAVLLPLVGAQGITLSALPLVSLLSALQRLDLAHAARLPMTLLQVVTTIALLESGGGVLSLAWLQLGLAVAQAAVRWIACVWSLPSFALAFPRRSDFAELRAVGAPMIVLNLLWAMALGFERAWLGRMTDMATFAHYAVASRLVFLVLELQQIPGATLLQASTALEAAGEREALTRLYERGLRLTALVVGGAIGGLWVAGPPFLRAWAGADFELGAALVGRLALAFLLPGLCQPGVALLAGASRLGGATPLLLAWAFACVAIDGPWIWLRGIDGAGVALILVNAAGTAAFLRHVAAASGVRSGGPMLLRAVVATMGAIVVGLAVRAALGSAPAADRLASLVDAAVSGAAFVGAYLAGAWRLGVLESRDLRLVGDVLGRRPAGA